MTRRSFLSLLGAAGITLAVKPDLLIGDPDESILIPNEIQIGENLFLSTNGIVVGPASISEFSLPYSDEKIPRVESVILKRELGRYNFLHFHRNTLSYLRWTARTPMYEMKLLKDERAILTTTYNSKSFIIYEKT